MLRRPGDTGDRAAAEAIASGDMIEHPVLIARHGGKPFFRNQPRLTAKGIEVLRRELRSRMQWRQIRTMPGHDE